MGKRKKNLITINQTNDTQTSSSRHLHLLHWNTWVLLRPHLFPTWWSSTSHSSLPLRMESGWTLKRQPSKRHVQSKCKNSKWIKLTNSFIVGVSIRNVSNTWVLWSTMTDSEVCDNVFIMLTWKKQYPGQLEQFIKCPRGNCNTLLHLPPMRAANFGGIFFYVSISIHRWNVCQIHA